MSYTTFREAREYVRSASGSCSTKELSRLVNTIRRHLYQWYQEVQLFADVVECFSVQQFRDATYGDFQGVTLPRECQTVEAMWWNGWPVVLRSSWREWQRGIAPECECGLQKFDLPGFFSTVADIPRGKHSKLRIRCEDQADIGKKFIVRGTSIAGGPFVQEIALTTELQETPFSVMQIDQQGGVTKEMTAGRVIMAAQNGMLLGIYEPDEVVPSYKRIKITGLPSDCSVVNLRCARRYYPLIGDDDVVETDNAPAFDAMARYLRIYEKSSIDQSELAIARSHIATAKQHVLGELSRETGKSTQIDLKVIQPGRMPIGRRLRY